MAAVDSVSQSHPSRNGRCANLYPVSRTRISPTAWSVCWAMQGTRYVYVSI